MDHYDEVVEKTVRDLFRSYPLIQIKKYIMKKEGEINDKDNELKTLILDKYPSLINSIDALEKISSNLNSLENIRTEFTDKLNNLGLDKIETTLKNISFDSDYFELDNNNQQYDYDNTFEQIHYLFNDKKYKEIIKLLIEIKNKFNANNGVEIENVKEKYNFYLIELVENIMNLMIDDKNICKNIEEYKTLFDDIYNNFICNEKETLNYLTMSELYLKIQYDKTINSIMKEYFNTDEKEILFSINIIIKIFLLKITQILIEISNTSPEILFNSETIDKINNFHQIIMTIKYLYNQYYNVENKNLFDEFYKFIKNEVDKNINSLLITPKNIAQKLHPHSIISFWNNLFSTHSNNEEVENNLLEYLFIEKSIEQLSNIFAYSLKQFSSNNFLKLKIILKNKNIKTENEIFLTLNEIYNISSDKENSTYKMKYIETIKNKLYQFLKSINENDNSDLEYMNFIIKIFSFSNLLKIIKEFNFDDIINIINELIAKNQKDNYNKINTYISNEFALQLKLEIYAKDTQKQKIYTESSISESLKQLIEFLFEIDIREEQHKINILSDIIDVYQNIIFNLNTKDKIFNDIILNDILILNEILKEISNENIINNLNKIIEHIKSNYNDKLSFNLDCTKYDGFNELNLFFKTNNYMEKQIDFHYTISNVNDDYKTNIDYLPLYVNKMNAFMLNKKKIDYTGRESAGDVSISNLYEYRIEESYLSIRQEKPFKSDNNSDINSGVTKDSNMLGKITGKLFNFINDE